MKLKTLTLTACLLVSAMLTGCGMARNFTNPFGNKETGTLPASVYSRDTVQHFPAGPEEELPDLKGTVKQYQLEQQGDTTPE